MKMPALMTDNIRHHVVYVVSHATHILHGVNMTAANVHTVTAMRLMLCHSHARHAERKCPRCYRTDRPECASFCLHFSNLLPFLFIIALRGTIITQTHTVILRAAAEQNGGILPRRIQAHEP